MAPSSAPPRLRWSALSGTVLAVALVLGGCGSSKKEDASVSTPAPATASTPASPSGTSGTSGSGGSSTTGGSTATTAGSSGPSPSSPSTLPPSVDSTCAALEDTYGIVELQPRFTTSWPDERQRIVVDGQREAQLLGAAQQGAPATIASDLVLLQSYATWIVTKVEASDDFDAAVAALNAYPDKVDAALSASSVDSWKRANC